MLAEFAKEADKIMPNKKLKSFFTRIYDPLKVTEEDQIELKSVLRAIIDISAEQGSILQLSEDLLKREALGEPSDYNMEQLKMAKKIFDECNEFDIKQNGQSRIIQKNLQSNFQSLNRDMVIGSEAYENPSIDQIAWRSLGQHKALNEGDLDKYYAIRQNKLTNDQIIEYLEEYRSSGLGSEDIFSSDGSQLNKGHGMKEYQDSDDAFNIDGMDFENNVIIRTELMKDQTNNQKSKDEQLKVKMFDELENIDIIIKSSENNIKLTKSEYLLHLRQIYHEKVTALKHQKDIFRIQLTKMQRAHSQQLRNIENFALSAAEEMFRKKGQQVRDLFQIEANHLIKEYHQIHSLIAYYEKKFNFLTLQMASQERLLINQFLYINEQARRKKKYTTKKEEAKTILQELMNERYSRIPPKEYMNDTFDFYGQGLRLADEDQKGILKSIVFKRQEKETMNYKIQVKLVRNEVEVMKILLESAQNQEAQIKIKLNDALKQLDFERDKFDKIIKQKDLEYQQQIQKMRQQVKDFVIQDKQYKQLTEIEIDILHNVIKQQKIAVEKAQRYKRDNEMMQHILKYPVLCKEFHSKIKLNNAFDNAQQIRLIQQVFNEHINDDPQMLKQLQLKQLRESQLRGRSSPVIDNPDKSLIINNQQMEVLSDDVKQYLGDYIEQSKRDNINPNSSQNFNSTTTRVLTTQQNNDNLQTSLTKTSVDWNKQRSLIRYNEIEELRPTNNTYSSIDTSYSQFYHKNGNVFSLPTTRAQMRGTGGILAFQQQTDPSNLFSGPIQQPSQLLNSLESQRRKIMNLSLNNFGQSSGAGTIIHQMPEIAPPSLRQPRTQRNGAEQMIPFFVNKRYIEHQLNKRIALKANKDNLLLTQSIHLKNDSSNYRSSQQRQAFYRRQKQFSLNERTVRINNSRENWVNNEGGENKNQDDQDKQKRNAIKRYNQNQSVDAVQTSVEREIEKGVIFDEKQIQSIFER